MKASYRKVHRLLDGERFYGIVSAEGRIVWTAPDDRPTRKRALADARRQLKAGPRSMRPHRARWQPLARRIRTDPDGRPILSRTYIEHFLQCVQYVDEHGPDAAFGVAIHAAIHAYYQLCLATHQESALSKVDDIVREHFFTTPGIEPERYPEAQDLVYRYVRERMAELSTLLIVDRQPAIEFTLRGDCGWFWLEGRADRIDRVDGDDPDDPPRILRIEDIKTGWEPYRSKVPSAPTSGRPAPIPHDFQRRIYAQLAFLDPRLNRSLEEVETVIRYPRNPREPVVIAYQRGELDLWFEDIKGALARKWQERDGPPTGCAACDNCGIRQTCGAALSDARGIPANAEEARDLAQKLIRITKVRRGYSVALQDFLRKRTAMVVNGLEIGYLQPREQKWVASDPIGIVNHLNALGLNGAAVLFTAIDHKLVPSDQKAPMVEADLARWDSGTPKFAVRKAGGDGEDDE